VRSGGVPGRDTRVGKEEAVVKWGTSKKLICSLNALHLEKLVETDGKSQYGTYLKKVSGGKIK